MATNTKVAELVRAGPNPKGYAGCCGEIDAFSKALNADADLREAVVVAVWAARKEAGEVMAACETCMYTAKKLGVMVHSPK
jgi:hypothetical protein